MNATTSRSGRLRKFIPQPDRYSARYGNFVLTARDLEILELVFRYRYVEARHIRALVGGSDQQITRRLQGLFHNGYLGRYARRERMRLDLDPGAPLMAHGLETKGARALQRHCVLTTTDGLSQTEYIRWKKDYTRRTEWFLEHHLMLSSFRCGLEIAVRQRRTAEIVAWEQGKDIWFPVKLPRKRRPIFRVAPDAYFVLRQRDQVRHFYVEVDRGTEEHRRLLDRFLGYWWHLRNDSLVGPSGGRRRANVLFITTSDRRMLNMIETLRRTPKPDKTHGGRGLFWFASEVSYARLEPQSLAATNWMSANQTDLALFEPVDGETHEQA